MNVGTNIGLKEKAREFASVFKLTPRETDVFALLAENVVSVPEIATQLGLSPHTVSNHFKVIFEKTGTTGRAHLLSVFMKWFVNDQLNCRGFGKKPNVMVIDDEPELAEIVSESLIRRGMNVTTQTDSKNALESILSMRLDAVVSDIRMPSLNGVELLKELRKRHRYSPFVVFISGYSAEYAVDELMDLGAVGVLEKPIDMDRLFTLIMDRFIDDPMEQGRQARPEVRLPVVLNLEKEHHLSIGNIGYGGVFIPTSEKELAVRVDEIVQFRFQLEESGRLMEAKGRVAWIRTQDKPGLPPGMGIQFVEMSPEDNAELKDYVLCKKIVSYIPSGSKSGIGLNR